MRAAIELHAVSQQARPGVVTLRDISLTVGPGELIAITGGSGSGKATLLNTMCGLCPPASGEVIRAHGGPAGYVPQEDILHAPLPLRRTLRYTAAVRGVRNGAEAVDAVLRALELTGREAVPVGSLPGGERKRASIAAELLAGPGLLFLDEPTSGLDPAHGAELMRILRRLCEDGMAVILTTQNPLDVDACDKVAVLAASGHLAFFGAPPAARGYFGADSTVEIYERLAGVGDPARNWSRRFLDSHLHRPPLPPSPASPPTSAHLHEAQAPGPAETAAALATIKAARPAHASNGESPGTAAVQVPQQRVPAGAALVPDSLPSSGRAPAGWPGHRVPAMRQWGLLAQRNADLLTRSRLTIAVMAGSPLAVLLSFLVLVRPGAFDAAHPSPSATVMTMFWVAFGGFFTGLAYGLLAIFPERGVLRRERLAGLGAGSYVLAKVSVLLPLLAAVDLVFLVVLRLLGRLPSSGDYAAVFVTLLLCSASALGLGLLISAATSEPSQAIIALPVACLPQLLLAGAILPVPVMAAVGKWISFAMTDRWSFEGLGHSLGVVRLWSSGASPLGPPLLASYGATFNRPVVADWLILGGFTLAFLAASTAVVIRKAR